MLESFVCFILLKRFLNTLYNNNINVVFSIGKYLLLKIHHVNSREIWYSPAGRMVVLV